MWSAWHLLQKPSTFSPCLLVFFFWFKFWMSILETHIFSLLIDFLLVWMSILETHLQLDLISWTCRVISVFVIEMVCGILVLFWAEIQIYVSFYQFILCYISLSCLCRWNKFCVFVNLESQKCISQWYNHRALIKNFLMVDVMDDKTIVIHSHNWWNYCETTFDLSLASVSHIVIFNLIKIQNLHKNLGFASN